MDLTLLAELMGVACDVGSRDTPILVGSSIGVYTPTIISSLLLLSQQLLPDTSLHSCFMFNRSRCASTVHKPCVDRGTIFWQIANKFHRDFFAETISVIIRDITR